MSINKISINKLPAYLQPIANHFQKQELKGGESLANSRFIQDTMTNLAPKALFSRSKADLFDMSFLEIAESMLVYYCPTIVGEKIFRKAYSKGLAPKLADKISTPLADLKLDKTVSADEIKKIKPIKAAISLSSMIIPLTEFTLNYFKNLFTLKIFKQSDFNNIANLDKKGSKKETKEAQNKVRNNAIKNILRAGGVFLGCVAASCLIAKKGKNSKFAQKVSDVILAPGDVLSKNNKKRADFINKYFSLDFSDNAGKLGLSHGQLTSCVLIGGLGYFGASKDRGKQNLLETMFRYPLVGFYVITGSELLEKGFKNLLKNKDGYKELIDKNLNIAKFSEFAEIAKKLSKEKGTDIQKEFSKLITKRAIITGIPFAFSIGFMGLFVAGVSRFFTQYRYNKEKEAKERNIQTLNFKNNFVDIDMFKKSVAK